MSTVESRAAAALCGDHPATFFEVCFAARPAAFAACAPVLRLMLARLVAPWGCAGPRMAPGCSDGPMPVRVFKSL